MNKTLRLVLILALALTGAAMGAGAGQPRTSADVVLCAGGAIVVTRIDDQGRPSRRAHLCPDAAPTLLAALLAVPEPPARPVTACRRQLPVPVRRRAAATRRPRSRDPPGVAFA